MNDNNIAHHYVLLFALSLLPHVHVVIAIPVAPLGPVLIVILYACFLLAISANLDVNSS